MAQMAQMACRVLARAPAASAADARCGWLPLVDDSGSFFRMPLCSDDDPIALLLFTFAGAISMCVEALSAFKPFKLHNVCVFVGSVVR